MTRTDGNESAVEQQIRELAAQLREYRERPCLLFVSRAIAHADVLAVCTSRLLLFKALEQLQVAATNMYGDVVSRILKQSGMRPFGACSKAAELTSSLCGPLYAQLDPARLAESARGLELGGGYAERLLRRYRPAFYAENGRGLIQRLVHDYPAHSFILDWEEVQELGLPARLPDAQEAPLLHQLTLALIEYGTHSDLIALAGRSAETIAAVDHVLAGMEAQGQARKGTPRRRSPLARKRRPKTSTDRADRLRNEGRL